MSTTEPEPVPQAAPEESSQRTDRAAALLSPTPRLAGGVQIAPLSRTQATGAQATGAQATGAQATGAQATGAQATRRGPTPTTDAPVPSPVRARPASPAAGAPPPTTAAPTGAAPTAAAPAPRRAPVPNRAAAPSAAATPPPQGLAAPPAPAPPAPPARPRDELVDQVSDVLESLSAQIDRSAPPREGRSTPADLAAARRVFEDLAVGHVAQVRDVMLELQLGDVACSWVESSRPALRSLRSMAAQMELADLCGALDDFCAAVDAVVAAGRAQIDGPGKDELTGRYQRLIELIPRAFALDGERDRREPIIVESLLRQVDGVEALTVDKLRAVGLGRLDTLLAANADDMAATSGIRHEVAVAITLHLRAYRDSAAATVAAPDVAAAQREIKTLLGTLRRHHDQFERAAAEWSDDARVHKRALRKERDQAFLRIKVTLARLGERDRITRLDKVPFQERIADLERFVAALASPNHGG